MVSRSRYLGAVSRYIRPVGREPSSIYWIRRGAVVMVVLVFLFLIWWLVSGRGSSEDAALGEGEVNASETAVDGIGADGTAGTAATGPVDCMDQDMVVRAKAAKKSYTVGDTPELTLSIKNTGSVACVRDVGPLVNEIEIKSGGYHVWSSDDCNASKRSKIVTMQPGEVYASAITWNGRLSSKGCPDPKGAKAKPGSYTVIGRNADVESDGRKFSLSPAKEAEPKKETE